MLNKKLSYVITFLLLLVPLTVYVFANGISGISGNPLPLFVLGLLLAVPLIVTLAIGRMYTTARLPKDISWLLVAFLSCWAFVCSNVTILASRQSTMQYGTVLTLLDIAGFDVSGNYSGAVRLEVLAVLLISAFAIVLLIFIPSYSYWSKRRRIHNQTREI